MSKNHNIGPEGFQDRPKSLQDFKFRVFPSVFKHLSKTIKPKSAKERPKIGPGGLSRRPGEHLGTILKVRNSRRAPFERDLLRDSTEYHVRNDFPIIFESCA